MGPECDVVAGGNVDVGVREVMPQKLSQKRDGTHVRGQNRPKRRKRLKQKIFSLPRMGAGRGGNLCANPNALSKRPSNPPQRFFLLTVVKVFSKTNPSHRHLSSHKSPLLWKKGKTRRKKYELASSATPTFVVFPFSPFNE